MKRLGDTQMSPSLFFYRCSWLRAVSELLIAAFPDRVLCYEQLLEAAVG